MAKLVCNLAPAIRVEDIAYFHLSGKASRSPDVLSEKLQREHPSVYSFDHFSYGGVWDARW